MRAIRVLVGVVAMGATMGGLGACTHTNTAYGDVAPTEAIGLRVENDNFLDMDVFAVAHGLATRIGTVSGNSAHTFTVDPSLATQDFSIVATPIGGNGRASTGSIIAGPGQTIDFRIGSTLSNSSVYIR